MTIIENKEGMNRKKEKKRKVSLIPFFVSEMHIYVYSRNSALLGNGGVSEHRHVFRPEDCILTFPMRRQQFQTETLISYYIHISIQHLVNNIKRRQLRERLPVKLNISPRFENGRISRS